MNVPSKAMKIIKDHHSKTALIVNVKFVDWGGPQGKYYNIIKNKSLTEPVRKNDVPVQE